MTDAATELSTRTRGGATGMLHRAASVLSRTLADDELQFGPKWVGLAATTLAVAGLSGRALYMDGAHHVVHALLHWDWFPQPTPRRFFAILWNTGLIRLLNLVRPNAIDASILLYALTAFSELVLPAAAIAWSNIRAPLKSVFAAFYFSAILILGNFAVTESLFALALTTIFAVYTIDPSSDPRGWRRLLAAILLVASYESVALSNLLLAFSCWREAKEGEPSKPLHRTLIGLLCLAPIFQIVWYRINPVPRAGIGLFVVIVAIAQFLLLLAIAAGFRLVRDRILLRRLALALAFAGPVALFFVPPLLHMRSELFRFAYPSRFYGMGAMAVIALLPLLADERVWRFPSKLIAWYGERPAKDLGLAMCLLFCGMTLLTALDAFSFRAEMQRQFSRLSGTIPYSQCAFCVRPEAFGVADLGFPWTWQEYSMAYSLHRHDGHPVFIMADDKVQTSNRSEVTLIFSKAEIDAFMAKLKATPPPARP